MGGIANGIAYHGGFIPYVATFLTFSDYMRGSVRLAALTGLHVVYVWTHDSIGLGEDGPTHQPVEHYAALRAMPGLTFLRPGDPNEAVAAWRVAVEQRHGPVALALTRQKLPVLPGIRRARHRWRRPGRLCPRGRGRPGGPPGASGRHPHRHRLGAVTGHGRPRGADPGGHPDAGRLAAQLGAIRGGTQGIPRRGAAAHRAPAREHRGRGLAGLGPLGRPGGRHHRHRSVRRVGTRQRADARRSGSPRRTSRRWLGRS